MKILKNPVDKSLPRQYNDEAVKMAAICGCAGIGRLASLRCLCPDGRTGSTPVSRTNPRVLEFQGLWGFLLELQRFKAI